VLVALPLLISVLSALVAGQMIGRNPRAALPLLGLTALLMVPAVVSRLRMRKLLRSGDVERLIGTWKASIERVPHSETIAPLLRATAYASYGWLDASRRALSRAVKGPAWDAAIEQRLFVETLLDTFEGDRETALRKADALQALPIPPGGLFARRRVVRLRRGLGAMARAFAHTSREGDAKVLSRAAGASPLVHWAMRYAGAVVEVDRGRSRSALALLANAPDWPVQSAFRSFHEELVGRARGTLSPA
jgi:hypothetical protein